MSLTIPVPPDTVADMLKNVPVALALTFIAATEIAAISAKEASP